MKKVFWFYLLIALFLGIMLCGCQYVFSSYGGELSVACWNAQTFFDANNDGCEYSDFRKSKYWSRAAYEERLKRLTGVIKELNCDVFVLEEIENEAVVMDIKNQLAGSSWSFKKNWNYDFFAKNDGSAIGCVVFSRFPLVDCKVHNMDVRCEDSKQPDSRPMLQVTVNFGKKNVYLFVNHWKSKVGGSKDSEIWRLWQESLLVERVIDVQNEAGTDSIVLICGDFNKDITEFQSFDGIDGNVVLSGVRKGVSEKSKLIVSSPWISSDGSFATEIGSYYYKNEWERIDHFFLCGAASISDFLPVAKEPWATSEGVPVAYKIYSGKGYSDHLPLKCKLQL